MKLKKVQFGTSKIQSLRRITLPQNILDTLGLDVGDLVQIELDTEAGIVLVSRATEQAEKPTPSARNSRAKRK